MDYSTTLERFPTAPGFVPVCAIANRIMLHCNNVNESSVKLT
jgi:hypothetical protein